MLLRSDLPGRRTGVSIIVVLLFLPLYLQASAWQAGFGQEGWYSHRRQRRTVAHRMERGRLGSHLGGHSLGGFVCRSGAADRRARTGRAGPARWNPLAGIPPGHVAGMLAGLGSGGSLGSDVNGRRNDGHQHFLRCGPTPRRFSAKLPSTTRRAGAMTALLPGILGTLVLLGLGMFVLRPAGPARAAAEFEAEPSFRPGRWRWPLALGVLAAMLLLAGVPLGNLVYKAGVLVVQTDVGRVRTWSAGKCLRIILLAPWQCRRECQWSLVIGSLAATAAVVAAIPLAWLARKSRWLGHVGHRGRAGLPRHSRSALGPGDHRSAEPARVAVAGHAVRSSILAPWMALTVRAMGPAVLVLWHARADDPPAACWIAPRRRAAVGWANLGGSCCPSGCRPWRSPG